MLFWFQMPTENPFQDPLRFERRVPECAAVIFGANGDLTRRKLMPALYRLAYDRRLSAGFAVVGISRTPLSDDQLPREDARGRQGVLRRYALRRRRLARLRRRPVLRLRRHRRSRPLSAAGAKAGRNRSRPRHRRQRALLPFHSAQPVRAGGSRLGRRRVSTTATAGVAWWWKSRSVTTSPARAS